MYNKRAYKILEPYIQHYDDDNMVTEDEALKAMEQYAEEIEDDWSKQYRVNTDELLRKIEEISGFKSEIAKLKSSNPSIKRPTDVEINEAADKKYPEWMLAAGPRKSGFIDGINWLLSIQPDKL